MTDKDSIVIKGARTHNLKNIDVSIPRGKLVVLTGPSGSGKSSLAFDTVYAEGQRRYVESLSAYARQFLGLMDKPDVDSIEGLSPSISIEQKSIGHNPRSTLATATEIYDYLRLLFARVGTVCCHKCGKQISKQTTDDMLNSIIKMGDGTKFMVLSPIVRNRKGEHKALINSLIKEGFTRFYINFEYYDFSESDVVELDKYKNHTIFALIDRLTVRDNIEGRVKDSLETALRLSKGLAVIANKTIDNLHYFSEMFSCPDCDIAYQEVEPRLFSFNTPHGACPECSGLGHIIGFNREKLEVLVSSDVKVFDTTKDIFGILRIDVQVQDDLGKFLAIKPTTTWKQLSKDKILEVVSGGGGFVGFDKLLVNEYRHYRFSHKYRRHLEKFISNIVCTACKGVRLRKEALSVFIDNKNIGDVTCKSIEQSFLFFKQLTFSGFKNEIAKPIIKEILERLTFLIDVGVMYLTLNRSTDTLSGGESQRIRLATQIGSKLTGVIYILDEPSIGLHPRDNSKLIKTLKELRELGNTVIVVEHDKETMLESDYIIEIGPKAGENGGQIIATGTPKQIIENKKSLTGDYLSGRRKIETPSERRKGTGKSLILKNARGNNLKNITVEFPLGTIICVTGISGSGKSTLINDTLYPFIHNKIYSAQRLVLPNDGIENLSLIDKIIDIDQSPIGKTPRSNPATYTGIFDDIRNLFSQMHESRVRGYKPGRFSFNVKGGRCEFCEGAGLIKVEMNFLPDVYVKCDKCNGKRYKEDVLEVKYKGKNISEVLDMSVDQSIEFFKDIPSLKRKISVVQEVGLGYITLGQSSTTLSGGEAQRIKLSQELLKKPTGKTLYILDEPTIGLHAYDIENLLKMFHRFADASNTVIIIEHNVDVIKNADYIIDLGPEGGNNGGYVIYQGEFEGILNEPTSSTGKYLKEELALK